MKTAKEFLAWFNFVVAINALLILAKWSLFGMVTFFGKDLSAPISQAIWVIGNVAVATYSFFYWWNNLLDFYIYI